MSGNRDQFRAVMPAMLLHEGWWAGWYRHVDSKGNLIDQHGVKTRCELPDEGPFHYQQYNWLSWDDGRTAEYETAARIDGHRLVWDGDNFSGYGWQTLGNLIILRLDRRDVPGAHYSEMIDIAPDGQSRGRSWQWFKDGVPWKRTVCDEICIEGPVI